MKGFKMRWIRILSHKFKMLFKWLPVIWNNAGWDQHYLYDVIKKQLEIMIEEQATSIRWEKIYIKDDEMMKKWQSVPRPFDTLYDDKEFIYDNDSAIADMKQCIECIDKIDTFWEKELEEANMEVWTKMIADRSGMWWI